MPNTTVEIAPHVCPIKDDEFANAVIFYHAHCLDGFGAAYIVWDYAQKIGRSNVAYVPISYENELEEVKAFISRLVPNKHEPLSLVMFVDFCPSEATMASVLNNVICKVIVLDHHESRRTLMIAHNMEHEVTAIYSDKLSGVGLTYEYFWGADNTSAMPRLLAAIQDRDLWQFKYGGTKDICTALASTGNIPRDFASWRLAMFNYPNAVYKGSILNKDFLARCEKVADTALHTTILTGKPPTVETNLLAFTAYAVNAAYEYASEVGNILVSRHNIAAIVWQCTERGDVKCSVRSNDKCNTNAKEIAEAFGGGGHKHASSFTIGIKEWAAMLSSNIDITAEEIYDTE